jgi:tRNA nucleotidyltransferase/poly(A) polymerase
MMAASGILSELLPYALRLPRLEQLVGIETDNQFPPDALLRLAAILPDEADAARKVAERLKLSNAERARLEALALPGDKIAPQLSAAEVRRLPRSGAVKLGGKPPRPGDALADAAVHRRWLGTAPVSAHRS